MSSKKPAKSTNPEVQSEVQSEVQKGTVYTIEYSGSVFRGEVTSIREIGGRVQAYVKLNGYVSRWFDTATAKFVEV